MRCLKQVDMRVAAGPACLRPQGKRTRQARRWRPGNSGRAPGPRRGRTRRRSRAAARRPRQSARPRRRGRARRPCPRGSRRAAAAWRRTSARPTGARWPPGCWRARRPGQPRRAGVKIFPGAQHTRSAELHKRGDATHGGSALYAGTVRARAAGQADRPHASSPAALARCWAASQRVGPPNLWRKRWSSGRLNPSLSVPHIVHCRPLARCPHRTQPERRPGSWRNRCDSGGSKP